MGPTPAIAVPNRFGMGRRAQPRLRLGVPAQLLLAGGAEACRLIDLSRGGAALACRSPGVVGATGYLRCEQIEAFGEIVWAGRSTCGFRFDDPLPDSVLLAMRRAAPELLARQDHSAEDFARRWATGRY